MSSKGASLRGRGRHGTVLVVVMSLVVLLLIAGGVILQLMLNQTQATKHLIDRAKAFSLCEAGLNYALYRLGSEDSDTWTWLPHAFDPLKQAVTETIQEDWEFNGRQKDILITYIRDLDPPGDSENKMIKITVSY